MCSASYFEVITVVITQPTLMLHHGTIRQTIRHISAHVGLCGCRLLKIFWLHAPEWCWRGACSRRGCNRRGTDRRRRRRECENQWRKHQLQNYRNNSTALTQLSLVINVRVMFTSHNLCVLGSFGVFICLHQTAQPMDTTRANIELLLWHNKIKWTFYGQTATRDLCAKQKANL